MSGTELWRANGLWPGAAIVTRLTDQVPALREVLAIDQLDGNATQPKQTPSALVLLDGISPNGSNPLRTRTKTQQDWMVVLAVRSARPDPARNSGELGPLLPQVVDALQGWQPPGQNAAFDWIPGPKPSYGRDHSYFPLVFSIEVIAG